MPFFPRTESEIIKDSLDQMNRETNFTQLAPGSKVRFLLSTTGREQASQQSLFDENLLQPYIRYADGKFLDYFGDMLNLPRVEASHAEATGENFMWYVSSGVFGDINGGQSFTVPAGTVINTPSFEGEILTPGIEVQPIVRFTTTADVVCLAGSSFVYCPVRATIEGNESSVPRNVLTEHAFTGYSLSANDLLKCTNRYSIDNGTLRESDNSYRYRLQNIFKARSQAILAAIRIAALSVPGVADVTIINCEQGPGTYALYVKSQAPTASPSLIREVTAAVEFVSALGIRVFVSGARTLGVELVVAVAWSPNATDENISRGYANMRKNIETTLNEKDQGEAVDLSDIVDLIINSSPHVSSVGRAVPNKIEATYIYKPDPTGLGFIRSLLIGEKIDPLYNERVLLETGNRYRGVQFISI